MRRLFIYRVYLGFRERKVIPHRFSKSQVKWQLWNIVEHFFIQNYLYINLQKIALSNCNKKNYVFLKEYRVNLAISKNRANIFLYLNI